MMRQQRGIPFVKMHGLGNDYVYVDAHGDPSLESGDLPALSRRMSDRHLGIGSDGLILVCRPTVEGADVRMRMFNADGTEGRMCGNGVRCVARFAVERLGMGPDVVSVQTGRGVMPIECLGRGRDFTARVPMGAPQFDLPDVPADPARLEPSDRDGVWGVSVGGEVFACVLVSMGNAHAVSFVQDVEAFDLERIGPLVEHHPAFPERVNLHVAQVEARTGVRMRSWERGSGITLACGTGACAVVASGVRLGLLDEDVRVRLPGGELSIRWDPTPPPGTIWMTGPAQPVFVGVWPG